MATFDSLVKEILPYVPGCPEALVKSNLRSATIEFCEKSKAYVYDLEPITTAAGTYEYEFDQPVGTSVHSILWVIYNGDDLDPTSPRSLELNFPDWRDRSSVPRVYLQKDANKFWLIPVPNATTSGSVQVSVSLKPTRTASNIDTSFSNDYRDGLLYATLYRLLRMPSRAWTDMYAAQDYFNLFTEQVNQAEKRARSGDLGVRRLVKYKGVGLSPRKRYKRYGMEIDY
jgi:hypothetical protein